ncbi:MAG: hypothetical protein ACR2FV_15215 [Ornithinimicrobium sp.]|jgi:hypothetical protein|uniref:hypothetical protein n=1 Tax=Ornithinimicrobium sp. TaxID=1977084 RepID=UPI0017E608C6|nr:hypothetical protein [Actinomycetota bacterium]
MSSRQLSRTGRSRGPILRIVLVLVRLAGLGTLGGAAWAWSTAVTHTAGDIDFDRALVGVT